MAQPAHPPNPAIYHITHVDNLASICAAGKLWSDAERLRQGLVSKNIGYNHIKERRLKRAVPVAAKGKLGEYVPFYFCNRSIMLYVISRGHEDYNDGQRSVIHLVSSVESAVATGRPWAFTNRHAELGYADYFDALERLDEVDWSVMPLRQWGGDDEVKERRQAEFLVHERFPWTAVESIGVLGTQAKEQVESILAQTKHRPPVTCQTSWYY